MLPSFNEKEHPIKIKAVNITKAIIDQGNIERNFEVAKSRIINLKNVLQYDLGGSIFFLMVILPVTMRNICSCMNSENILKADCSFNKPGLHNTSLVADFMANLTKVNGLGCCINSCNFQRMDVLYGSYIKNSIKYSKRQRRKAVNSIMFYNLQTTSIIPIQMDKFWACNKENLYKMSRHFEFGAKHNMDF